MGGAAARVLHVSGGKGGVISGVSGLAQVLNKPEFEAYFVGAESKIDQMLSSTWLKKNTKAWTWKTFIMANTPRCATLAIPIPIPTLPYPTLAWTWKTSVHGQRTPRRAARAVPVHHTCLL